MALLSSEWLIGHKIAIKRRLGTDMKIVRGGGRAGALARKNSEMINKPDLAST